MASQDRGGDDADGDSVCRRCHELKSEIRELRAALERAQTYIAHLERVADDDPLVPLFNRRAFARHLGLTIAFAGRYGNPASLVYFDVDNLKVVNDSHGHAAGDAVLCHVALVMRANLRASDVAARVGGDEFAVLLQNANAATAETKARSLIAAVQERPVDLGVARVHATLAYGVHAITGTENDPETALKQADCLMYAQKRARSGTGRA